MIWGLKINLSQMNIGKWCCRHLKILGPYFAGKQRSRIALSLHSTVLNKPSAMLFVGLLDSTCLLEIPSDSNIQDSLLDSTVIMFLNFVHICLCQKGKNPFSNKKKWKKEKGTGFYWLFVQKHVLTGLIVNYSSVSILSPSLDILCWRA